MTYNNSYICPHGNLSVRYRVVELMPVWYFDGYTQQLLLKLAEQIKNSTGDWEETGRCICVTTKTLIESFDSQNSFNNTLLNDTLSIFTDFNKEPYGSN